MMSSPLLEATIAPRYTLTEAAAILQSVGANLAQPFLTSFNNTAALMSHLNQPQQPAAIVMKPVQPVATDCVPTKPEPKIAFRLTGPPIKQFDHSRLGNHHSNSNKCDHKHHRSNMHHQSTNGGGRRGYGGLGFGGGGGGHSGRRGSSGYSGRRGGGHKGRGTYRRGGRGGKYGSNRHGLSQGGQRITRRNGSGQERDRAFAGEDVDLLRDESDDLRSYNTRRRSYNGGGRYNNDVETDEDDSHDQPARHGDNRPHLLD